MPKRMTAEERQQMFEDRRRFKITHRNKGRKLSKEHLEKLVDSHRAVVLRPPPEDYLDRRAEMEARMLKAWKPPEHD